VDKVAEHQTDVFSHFASTLTPIIVNYIESQQEYDFSIALSYLKNWDYYYTKNSTAASIFDVFFLRFTENTLLDEFGDDSFRHFVRHELIPVRVMPFLIETNSGLFDNVLTNEVETIEDIIIQNHLSGDGNNYIPFSFLHPYSKKQHKILLLPRPLNLWSITF